MTDADDAADQADDGEGVSPADLARRLDRGDPITLLDVRNRAEIERWAIDGPSAVRTEIPYVKFQAARVNDTVADLAGEIEHAGGSADADESTRNGDPAIVVCGRGEVSDTVADLLVKAGTRARNLAGGMDEWGDLYTATRLDLSGTRATVSQYRRPSSGCLSYLVVSDREAVVVDPLWAFADRYEADAATLDASLTAAIDTHVHADHLSGLRELGERGIERVLPESAVARGVTFDTRSIAEGEAIAVGDTSLHAVSLPGHTTGMTGFAVGDLLLAGDSVFLDGVARPDLEVDTADTPGSGPTEASARGLADDLYETLTTRLARFDDETVIAPGHHAEETRPDENGAYTARLGELRDRFEVQETEREAFIERVLGGLGAQPANHERIVRTNLGVETVAEDEARTLELGPNNCAASVTAE